MQRGQRYRKLIYRLIGLGCAALLISIAVGQELAGMVVYAVAIVVALGAMAYLQHVIEVPLQDEREEELGRRASNITFGLFGYGGLFAFVALFLLDLTGRPSVGPAVETLLYAYAVITLTWGGIYTVLKRRA